MVATEGSAVFINNHLECNIFFKKMETSASSFNIIIENMNMTGPNSRRNGAKLERIIHVGF